jgi:hypothetical protein
MSSLRRRPQSLSQQLSFDPKSKHSHDEHFIQPCATGDVFVKGERQDFAALGVGQFSSLYPSSFIILEPRVDLDEAFWSMFISSSLRSYQQLAKSLDFQLRFASSHFQFEADHPNFNGRTKDIVRSGGLRASTEFPFAGIVWKGFLVKQYVICVPFRDSFIVPVHLEHHVSTSRTFSSGALHCLCTNFSDRLQTIPRLGKSISLTPSGSHRIRL